MSINIEAVAENAENKKHVKLTHGGGITTLIVDSKQAKYKGVPVIALSDEQKKKFENIILFMHLPDLKQIPKIIYA